MKKKTTRPLLNLGGLCSLLLIFLSACAQRTEPAPVTSVYRGPTYHDYEAASWREDTYKVRRGDTLYSIAFRANLDVQEVARLNNLTPPYRLQPDQVLQLKSATQIPAKNNSSSVTIANKNTNQPVTKVASEVVVSPVKNRYGEKTSSTAQVGRKATSKTGPLTPQGQPEKSVPSAQIRWQWPTQGQVVRRFSTQEPMNRGIEFSGSKGDSVVAAAAGKVVYVGTALRGYGRLIIVKHNDDYITAYGHNDNILVQEQQWVEAGQQIATMGNSGREDVRLRFELRLRGNSVNPENYLPRSR